MNSIDRQCPYYSGKLALKCAVNPSIPCKDCSEVTAGFNTNLNECPDNSNWMESLENAVMQAHGFDVTRQAFGSSHNRIRGLVIAIDESSGQDATAIVSITTCDDGSVYINDLEIIGVPQPRTHFSLLGACSHIRDFFQQGIKGVIDNLTDILR